MNLEEANEKILEIMNKDKSLSQEEIQLFKELMFQCNLTQQNKYGMTYLMYALQYNKILGLNLNKDQWDYLIQQSDLKQKNRNNWTPLIYALSYNNEQYLNLNLNAEQIDYLIKNSNLKQKDNNGYTPLMHALYYNKTQNLNLKQEQWDYIIKNSDLSLQDKISWKPLFLALVNNKTENLQLTIKQLQILYTALNEKQKQKTFQKLIQKNIENDNQYLEEINLFLYDFQFKTNEKILSWLTKNKNQDILEMIEKRDLFFQLNQELKEIDNRPKIATIKI